jgi:hypothetical protein
MSIFSRLRKRGAEDGSPSEASPNPPAPPSPPAAAPAPAPAPAPRASEPIRPPSPREPARAPVSIAPPRGNVQAPTAGMIGAATAPATAPAPAPAAARPPLVVAKPAAAPPAPPPALPGMVSRSTPQRPASPERAPAPPPAASAPVAVNEPAGGSLDLAIALALDKDVPKAAEAPSHLPPSAADEAALRATFEELAVAHVTVLRNAMLEVRWGEAQASWLELGRPALKSLRAMAAEVGHTSLVAALDGFVGALQALLEPGQPPDVSGSSREALLAAYAPLVTCLPRAFALEGERDRREPIVVRALLEQVADLEPLMVDKLMAAGLGTLATLFAARADEIAAVTGIPDGIAARAAARIQAFRRATPAALATIDPPGTIRELAQLVEQLRTEHMAFEEAARGWSVDARLAKKELRRQRQATFLQITIALVRLGEIDFALRLPKLAFARRIDDLERIVAIRAAAVRQAVASMESGPHPVAA